MSVTTLAYTGAAQTYTVPAGATFVTIECWGAAGGAQGGAGGLGGYAKGGFVVAPGTVLNVYVGGVGTTGLGEGWNGGGAGARNGVAEGAGGGASDVRFGGTALADRVIVAGGGGGGSATNTGVGSSHGGDGGGASGGDGQNGSLGGTQSSGNTLGIGASGGATSGAYYYGERAAGGGGGGFWGGNVRQFSGGGGGSGYTGTLTSPLMTNGVRAGNGQVVITSTNTAPTAPTLTVPPVSSYIFPVDPNAFAWSVNDPDPGDYQTRADFRYKRAGDAVWTTLTSVATTAPTFTLAAGTWTAGFAYEWQVCTYDNAGLASPWSASSFVNTITALTAPTITTPTAGATVYATPVALEWTPPVGFTSDAYQVQRNSAADGTGTMYYDSGIVAKGTLTASIPLDATAGRTDYLRVAFRYFGHWSPFASVSINNQFGPPHIPLLVLAQIPDQPAVTVTISNPAASGGYTDTLVNDIYRTSPDGTKVRVAANLPANSTFTDQLVGAGTNDYQVVAFAANGASATSY